MNPADTQELKLRPARAEDLLSLWNAIYTDPQWKQWDAPYYPLQEKSLKQFEIEVLPVFKQGEQAQLIEFEGKVIGSVTCYWESEATHWLEVGINIYLPTYWNRQLGRQALSLWLHKMFENYDVARIGLSTWSGNPAMIACAQSVGMCIEGVLRKVRYYNGQYYDAVKMGVLREEWFDQHPLSG